MKKRRDKRGDRTLLIALVSIVLILVIGTTLIFMVKFIQVGNVGIIKIEGIIRSGKSTFFAMGSDDIIELLDKANIDPNIKVIIWK